MRLRIAADALDHGSDAVGALGRQMLGQAEFLEQAEGVGGQRLRWGLAVVEGDQERHEAAHDMGIAVAAKMQNGLAVRGIRGGLEPDLAGAALDLVDVVIAPRRAAAP